MPIDLLSVPTTTAGWRALIAAQWRPLARAADTDGAAQRYLDRALTHSERVEREHRRFTGGRYRLSVMDCARMFVIREVARHLWCDGPRPACESWAEAADVRADIVAARACAERLLAVGVYPWPKGEATVICEWDYSRDAAQR